MWFAELLAGLLHGFGELMTGTKWGRRVVVAMMIVVVALVAYLVVAWLSARSPANQQCSVVQSVVGLDHSR